MMYSYIYYTPREFDDLKLFSDGTFLTGVCFIHSKNAQKFSEDAMEASLPIFEKTVRWLDVYFSGRDPGKLPPYRLTDASDFQQEVAERMLKIPYGKTVTYGQIADELAEAHHIRKMSAQAVGGAVGRNPLCILIPCHRVVGTGGKMTGYGGGLSNKIRLLQLEKVIREP